MTSNANIQTYARQLASKLEEVSKLQDEAKDLIASAKDAGVNVTALRKVAKELTMESDKRAKLYETEDQIDMFRSVCGLTSEAMREAAE